MKTTTMSKYSSYVPIKGILFKVEEKLILPKKKFEKMIWGHY